MEKLLISACLTGVDCKYSGGNNKLEDSVLAELKEKYELFPVCPERDGGLSIPREPSERLGDKVVSRVGRDVTAEFVKGAQTALQTALENGCKKALLKANSPSCGKNSIYDGSFSGILVPGKGVTAELLEQNGISVFTEKEIKPMLL